MSLVYCDFIRIQSIFNVLLLPSLGDTVILRMKYIVKQDIIAYNVNLKKETQNRKVLIMITKHGDHIKFFV